MFIDLLMCLELWLEDYFRTIAIYYGCHFPINLLIAALQSLDLLLPYSRITSSLHNTIILI